LTKKDNAPIPVISKKINMSHFNPKSAMPKTPTTSITQNVPEIERREEKSKEGGKRGGGYILNDFNRNVQIWGLVIMK